MHAAPFCRLRCADTIDHGPGLCGPFFLVPQTRQWRFRERVERAPAGLAVIAWQIRRLTPTYNVAAVSLRAADAIHAPLPELSHAFRCNWDRCQRGRQIHCDRPFARGRQVDARHRENLRYGRFISRLVRRLQKSQSLPCPSSLVEGQRRNPPKPGLEIRHVHDRFLTSTRTPVANINSRRHKSHEFWSHSFFGDRFGDR